MWCSQRECISMFFTITISPSYSSGGEGKGGGMGEVRGECCCCGSCGCSSCSVVKSALLVTVAVDCWYPLVRKRRALAQRVGVFSRPSRWGFSPMHWRIVVHADVIFCSFSSSLSFSLLMLVMGRQRGVSFNIGADALIGASVCWVSLLVSLSIRIFFIEDSLPRSRTLEPIPPSAPACFLFRNEGTAADEEVDEDDAADEDDNFKTARSISH
eukprot:CAMPEP_0198272682 /NCGR_PEP_ID=MMETSP1447-20131203/54134_1 /TAXON_ID=420782 /ORGANISM="Chaetoceros dichaeta, Strain CCMP1751" /LENGTH=212 /DNA_ID=CAMNT_0043966015 /DNA_START=407 /DNA_END=1045 /DNA_ORIENTATION=+